MGTLALIGLGSNLGDRKAQLDGAVDALGGLPESTLRAVSRYHETAPVGGPIAQGSFLNAAAAVETGLDPFDLLRCLQAIENRAGRVRTVRWGERTLDLDLLLFGDRVIRSYPVVNRVFGGETIVLQVPHPRMALRRFVLSPLAEIAPTAVDPLTGRSIDDLLANLDRRPSLVTIHGDDRTFVDALFPRLVDELQGVGFTYRTQREMYRKLAISREFLRETGQASGGRFSRTKADTLGMLESWLERYRHDLSAERRPFEGEGDRWLVSDFWIDEAYKMARPVVDDPARLLARLIELQAGVIAPTFVVVPRGFDLHSSHSSRRDPSWPEPLGDAPTLAIDPNDSIEAIAREVVTTCEATRPAR